MPKTVILWVSDMHSGSPVALYPDSTLPLMNGPRGPSRLQLEIYKHWRFVLDYTAEARKDADKMVLIILGDVIENNHHASKEVISSYLTDHQKIAETLLREAKEVTRPDVIYFVDGTPDHAGENEYILADVLGGERYAPGKFTWPILKKTVGSKLIYAAHHGASPGRGVNFGNGLRNYMRNLVYACAGYGQPVPDLIVYGHHHAHCKEIINISGRDIEGRILPSWKLLDGYMNKINPFAFNNIGAMLTVITDKTIESEFLVIHVEQDVIGEL